MKKSETAINNFSSPLFVRLIIGWCVFSAILLLFLLWYVLDGTRRGSAGETDNTAPLSLQGGASQTSPTAGYQIEIGSENPEVSNIVSQVADHMLLPRGEVKVTTIVDVDGLRAQFPGVYDYAENGQKAIFYPNGLIIFDTKINKIVDVVRLPGGP